MTHPIGRRPVLALLLAGVGHRAAAQQATYPERPVTLVVPFAAGGIVDSVARALGTRLSAQLGQPVLVENRAGAAGNLGAAFVAKAKADGHTLLVSFDSIAANPHLYKLTFDPDKELAPIALVGTAPLLLVVNPALPVTNVREFVALAKSKPGGLAFASTGAGSSNHLAMEAFERAAGVELVHVPYKGGAPAMTDLVGGQIQAMFIAAGSAVQFVKTGKARALGVSTRARMKALPDVPPVAQDIPGFDMASWIGLFAPAGTPPAVVARLNGDVQKALEHPELRLVIDNQAVEAGEGSPAVFGQFVKAESQKLGDLIRRQNIKVD